MVTTESQEMRRTFLLQASGQIGEPLAAALQAEARRRATAGECFGHIAYMSLTARKPAP